MVKDYTLNPLRRAAQPDRRELFVRGPEKRDHFGGCKSGQKLLSSLVPHSLQLLLSRDEVCQSTLELGPAFELALANNVAEVMVYLLEATPKAIWQALLSPAAV